MTAARNAMPLPMDDGDAIYRVDTVPPPDGEDSAYSAATKVGPMAQAYVEQLMAAADDAAKGRESAPPHSVVRSRDLPKPAGAIAKVYESDEGDLFDPTAVFGRPPVTSKPVASSGMTERIDADAIRAVVAAVDSRRVVPMLPPSGVEVMPIPMPARVAPRLKLPAVPYRETLASLLEPEMPSPPAEAIAPVATTTTGRSVMLFFVLWLMVLLVPAAYVGWRLLGR